MHSYDTFGIPVPILYSNPYRLTVSNLVHGKISLPEGPLVFVTAKIDNWIDEVIHSTLGYNGWDSVGVRTTMTPPFKYYLTLNNKPLSEADRKGLILSAKQLPRLPTAFDFKQLLECLHENMDYIVRTELKEFIIQVLQDSTPNVQALIYNYFPQWRLW